MTGAPRESRGDLWARWAREGAAAAARRAVEAGHDGWSVARGPDRTARVASPATRCPVCSKPGRPVMVPAGEVAAHGMAHRRALGLN